MKRLVEAKHRPIGTRRKGVATSRKLGRPTREQAQQLQAQLLDQALDIFLDRGFEQTTMDAIAVSAGMSKRTMYLRYEDKAALFKPDQVVDLERFPWPWPDSSADEVLLNHVLEHLGQHPDTFIGVMKELWRVCAPGARVRVHVPDPRHEHFLGDHARRDGVRRHRLGIDQRYALLGRQIEPTVAGQNAGRLGAAVLDVFFDEPKVPAQLLELYNVVLTPHIASSTEETMGAMGATTPATSSPRRPT